jgi:multiple sugar transport system permease protein
MMIPKELRDAAAIDGATDTRLFVHITVPLLANLYLVCTLLATIWAIGEFNTAFFVSNGSPVMSTEMLATLGFRYTFDSARAALGAATMISALPLLVPIAIILVRRIQTREVQL